MSMTPHERQRAAELESDTVPEDLIPVDENFEAKEKLVDRVRVRISAEDAERIDEHCRRLGVGRSMLLRMALKRWLSQDRLAGEELGALLERLVGEGIVKIEVDKARQQVTAAQKDPRTGTEG